MIARTVLGAALAALVLAPMANAAPSEDSPEWSCIADGNRTCGPGNEQGAQPGCYDDRAALVAPWPCYIVVNPDGSADVYTD